MTDKTDPGFADASTDLRKHLQTLRARKWSVIVVVVLVVGAALGFSAAQTPLYRAEARLLVRPLSTPGATVSQPLPVDVGTEAEVVDSQPVARLVRDELESDESLKSLQAGLTVSAATPPSNVAAFLSSQVLRLEFTSPDPKFARDAVNAFADKYIEYRREQALNSLETLQRSVESRIESTTEQLEDVTAQLDEAFEDEDQTLISSLGTQRSVILTRLGTLQERLDALQPDEVTRSGGAAVIEAASLPSSPVSPVLVKNGVLAAFVGLILGIGLALLRERLDDRFRGGADVEEALEAPVLAAVPKFDANKAGTALITRSESKAVASEAYRSLRTNLQFAIGRRGLKSLVVTSPSAGEGKTVTTANLAVTLAKAGLRVVIVSADLRRPTLERHFGLDKRHGLATYLDSSDGEPWEVIRDPGIRNLRVIPSGPVPDSPAELLVSPRLGQLLDFLEANCDLALIDSPPILAVSDAAIIASRVGGTILVIDASKTARSASVHAREQIERGGGELVGVVLNSFDPQGSPYYAPYNYSTYESDTTSSSTNGGDAPDDAPSSRGARSLFGFRR